MARSVRHAGSLLVIGDGGFAADCLTCSHCQAQIIVKPDKGHDRTMELPKCYQCFWFICRPCHAELAKPGAACAPWEKRMDAMERRDRLLKAIGT